MAKKEKFFNAQNIDNNFPAHMKKLRNEIGLTQQQVADLLNLERTSISKYEAGQSSPNPETLLSIAKIYNVSVDYLIRGESEDNSLLKVSSPDAPYSNSSTLPLFDTQNMHSLSKDEQFLVLYFRMMDHDPKILDYLRQEFKKRSGQEP